MDCFHVAVAVAESGNCDYFLQLQGMNELSSHLHHKIHAAYKQFATAHFATNYAVLKMAL